MQKLNRLFDPALVVRGAVTLDLYDNQLIVARRSYGLDSGQMSILASLVKHPEPMSLKTLEASLGFDESQCRQSVHALQETLSQMSIANEGGLDSVFEYPAIYADSLIIVENNQISFNHFLAQNIKGNGYTNERVACQLLGLKIA